MSKMDRKTCKSEVDILKRLRHHTNIVHFYEAFLSRRKDALCIIMEYYENGDLHSFLQKQKIEKRIVKENVKSTIIPLFLQMALGLHYMHTLKVLHRDIKTENIFLANQNHQAVLGDLGVAKELDHTGDMATTCIGTPFTMAPELFKKQPYSYASDVWSLGCVLYEMIALHTPFLGAKSMAELVPKVTSGAFPPLTVAQCPDKNLRVLVASMLTVQSSRRPTMEAILTLPWIHDILHNSESEEGDQTNLEVEVTVGKGLETPTELEKQLELFRATVTPVKYRNKHALRRETNRQAVIKNAIKEKTLGLSTDISSQGSTPINALDSAALLKLQHGSRPISRESKNTVTESVPSPKVSILLKEDPLPPPPPVLELEKNCTVEKNNDGPIEMNESDWEDVERILEIQQDDENALDSDKKKYSINNCVFTRRINGLRTRCLQHMTLKQLKQIRISYRAACIHVDQEITTCLIQAVGQEMYPILSELFLLEEAV